MTVSIILPSYNHVDYVADCFESIYRQTSSTPIELIYIDDCSRDGTFERAKGILDSTRYRDRFQRIVAIRNEQNSGAPASFNRAIGESRGELIFLTNTDDLYDENRVDAFLGAVDPQEVCFAFSQVAFFGDRKRVAEFSRFHAESMADALFVYPSIEFGFLRHHIALSTGNFCFSRKLWDRIGRFEDFSYCHDWDFALAAISITRPIYIDRPLYWYRLHENNSYLALQDKAGSESERILKKYFMRDEYRKIENRYAPGRRNWPDLYEEYLAQFGMMPLFQDISRGARPHHRTVKRDDR